MAVNLCYLWPLQQKAPRGVPTYYQCGLLLSVCCAFQQSLGHGTESDVFKGFVGGGGNRSFVSCLVIVDCSPGMNGTVEQMKLHFVQFCHIFLLFGVSGFRVFTLVLLISLLINVTLIALPQTCHIIFWCLAVTITLFGVSVRHLLNIIIYFKYKTVLFLT